MRMRLAIAKDERSELDDFEETVLVLCEWVARDDETAEVSVEDDRHDDPCDAVGSVKNLFG